MKTIKHAARSAGKRTRTTADNSSLTRGDRIVSVYLDELNLSQETMEKLRILCGERGLPYPQGINTLLEDIADSAASRKSGRAKEAVSRTRKVGQPDAEKSGRVREAVSRTRKVGRPDASVKAVPEKSAAKLRKSGM